HHFRALRSSRQRPTNPKGQSRLPLVAAHRQCELIARKPYETVGAQILSVPMAVPLKLARDAYFTFMGILVAIFAVVFVILNLLLHYLVLVPVKRVSKAADAVSMGEENVEVYVKPGKDEISSLSIAFNRMQESLKHAMEMLK
ncbi:MAG: HAMP domain-containing protein, partial [Roseiarcus sp.]